MEKNIRRKQTLLDIISREVEENMQRPIDERKKMEVEQAREEEPINCMENPAW